MWKRNVVFDFDGVIHSYESGWQGVTIIPDPPVEGIHDLLKSLSKKYDITIVSSRCVTSAGIEAIWEYLEKYGLDEYIKQVSDTKPPAYVSVDDRAICFNGDCTSLEEKIDNFKVWNK